MALIFSLGPIATQHLTKLHNIHILYTIVQVTVNSDITGTALHVPKATQKLLHAAMHTTTFTCIIRSPENIHLQIEITVTNSQ